MGGNLSKKKRQKNCFKLRVKFNDLKTKLPPERKDVFVAAEVSVDYKILESYGCSERVILRKTKSVNPEIKLFRRSLEGNQVRQNLDSQLMKTRDGDALRRMSLSQEEITGQKFTRETIFHSRRSPSLSRHSVKRHSSSLSIHSIGYRGGPYSP